MKISPEDRLLLDCLTGRSFPEPGDGAGWQCLVDRSMGHGVSPYLYRYLKKEGAALPRAQEHVLQHLYLEAAGANAGLFHELGIALRALQEAAVPVIVLKGAHLAESVYGDIALRPMCDIDLLVKRRDLARAQEVLIDAGYPPQGERFPVDLHWSLCDSRPELTIDMEEVWESAVPVKAAGVDVLALAPEDQLTFVCTHFSHQHLFRSAGLRTLLDIREILDRHGRGLRWEIVLDRARQWDNGRGVSLSLHLARELIGAAVPGEALGKPPAIIDEDIRNWAVGQIFAGRESCCDRELSPYFWQLWNGGTWREKLGYLRNLVLPPRESISQKYPVAVGAKKSLYYYAIRFREHAADYGRALWRIVRRDRAMLAAAEQINRDIAMRERLSS